MSLTILEKVKEFLIRLVKDEAFRTQLTTNQIEDARKVMADNGYNFSQDEFETAAIEILKFKELGHFEELSEAELIGAIGGLTYSEPIIQPMYGVIVEPPEDEYPRPYPKPRPRPRPCFCKPPIDIQPMYGVIQPKELM
ncbi:MAG: hypothetical protein Tsb0014_12490 [Pleurocapsa sp.]